MKIYNSLTNKKEEFKPLKAGELSMYVCGPTVYNYMHIGNARPVIFFDVVARYFAYRGYQVKYASNVTDVDDKIIAKAIADGISETDVTKKYIKAFFEDIASAGCNKPSIVPYATEYIAQMISFINELIEAGYAYNVDGDVFFRVSKASSYGVLSNQNTEDLEVGARIAENSKKENPLDFTLWKKTDVGIKWNSPWGAGRPGWHTECVVMIDDIFHGQIDIHGGGVDLKFPHHENEIVQYQVLHKQTIANQFMHVGRVSLNDEKMSKSLGNVIWLRALLEKHHAGAYRILLLSSAYRQPVNYTSELMDQFDKEYEKIERCYKGAFRHLDITDAFTDCCDEKAMQEFITWMDDDFNTPNALMVVNDLIKKINLGMRNQTEFIEQFNALKIILDVLGISIIVERLTTDERDIYQKWLNARNAKDFALADELRGQLASKGII